MKTTTDSRDAQVMVIKMVRAKLKAALDGIEECSPDEALARLDLVVTHAAYCLDEYKKIQQQQQS